MWLKALEKNCGSETWNLKVVFVIFVRDDLASLELCIYLKTCKHPGIKLLDIKSFLHVLYTLFSLPLCNCCVITHFMHY